MERRITQLDCVVRACLLACVRACRNVNACGRCAVSRPQEQRHNLQLVQQFLRMDLDVSSESDIRQFIDTVLRAVEEEEEEQHQQQQEAEEEEEEEEEKQGGGQAAAVRALGQYR